MSSLPRYSANDARSAATILSLLEEGTFDYGSIFTGAFVAGMRKRHLLTSVDQAPLTDFDFNQSMVQDV